MRLTACTTRSTLPQEELPYRDQNYVIFHALGKICYNRRTSLIETMAVSFEPDAVHKRVPSQRVVGGGDAGLLPNETQCRLDDFGRGPLAFEPEHVIGNTHIDSEPFNRLLHENYWMFVSDIDDMADASASFSDADFVSRVGSESRYQPAEQLSQYSTSIASRGVLYYNRHIVAPVSNRFHKPTDAFIRPAMAFNREYARTFDGTAYGPNDIVPSCTLRTERHTYTHAYIHLHLTNNHCLVCLSGQM